jgi:hypothetical protein
LTFLRADSSLVVSPPISIVMPFIRLAIFTICRRLVFPTAPPSLRVRCTRNAQKNAPPVNGRGLNFEFDIMADMIAAFSVLKSYFATIYSCFCS